MAVSELEARQVAEEARETSWKKPSFLKEIFLGSLRLDLVPDFPPQSERPEFLLLIHQHDARTGPAGESNGSISESGVPRMAYPSWRLTARRRRIWSGLR